MIAVKTTHTRTRTRASHAAGRTSGRHSAAPMYERTAFHYAANDNTVRDRVNERVSLRFDDEIAVDDQIGVAPVRRKATEKAPFLRRGWVDAEASFIPTLVACFALVCILGVVYLGAYMNVAYQGRHIHNMQVELTAQTARQHALINEIGQLESPSRIAVEATKMGMVMGDKADYVTVHPSNKMASSRPTSLGPTGMLGNSMGDN